MRLVETSRSGSAIDAAEWQARVDLAAAHRMAVSHGFSEGIFNHFTLSVPGRDDRYYQIPFGLHWSEVTASVLMEIGYGQEAAVREVFRTHGRRIDAVLPDLAGIPRVVVSSAAW